MARRRKTRRTKKRQLRRTRTNKYRGGRDTYAINTAKTTKSNNYMQTIQIPDRIRTRTLNSPVNVPILTTRATIEAHRRENPNMPQTATEALAMF